MVMLRGAVVSCAALLCALVLVGCTDSSPQPAARTSGVAGPTQCGSDIPASGLLDATNIPAPKGSAVGRSAGAVQLAPGSCGTRPTKAVTVTGCDPADFPWTTSPESRNQELFRQSVGVVREATYEVGARPVLREVVLDASPGGALAQAYRDHLQRCGLTVVALANGVIQQATLSGGGRHLVVAFNGDDQIVGLQGLAGQRADELGRLMPPALTALG